MTITETIYSYHVILPHATEPRVLLHETAQGVALPQWETRTRRFWQTVDHVNRSVCDLWGATVFTVRPMRVRFEDGRVTCIYVLENLDPTWQPHIGRWYSRADLDGLSFAVQEERVLLESWFADDNSAPQRVDWYKPGWFATAQAWIDAEVARNFMRREGAIEQKRAWQRCSLLRVPVTGGEVWFKALPAFFGHELRLMYRLHQQYPDNISSFLTWDSTRNWMLMPSFGDTTLAGVTDIGRWEEAIRVYARIQIEQAGQVVALRTDGVPYLGVDALIDGLDTLLADDAALRVGQRGGLSEAERAAFYAAAPRLKALCAELGAFGLPLTLEHGDLWSENIAATATGYIFFDWSDCSISHPFFSLYPLLLPQYLPDNPDVAQRVRDAYLDQWREYAPPETLQAAFKLAQRLAPLYFAVLYHRIIVPQMEFAWEMQLGVPYNIKQLLMALDRET